MLAASEVDTVADLTAIWAATRGIERGDDGKFPVRLDSDPAIRSGLATYLRAVVVRQSLALGLRVAVTSGSPRTAVKWQQVARENDALFSMKTIDPGEATVRERLAVDGVLSASMRSEAVRRWYS